MSYTHRMQPSGKGEGDHLVEWSPQVAATMPTAVSSLLAPASPAVLEQDQCASTASTWAHLGHRA